MKNRRYLLGIFIVGALFLILMVSARNSMMMGMHLGLWHWVLIGLLIALVISYFANRTQKSTEKTPPQASRKIKEHYESEGLTEEDITFFRTTMAQAKDDILQLEKNIQASPKLKAIDLRNHTLKASKGIFKQLVEDPQKLHLADHFLYTHLPNLVELTGKFLDIQKHPIKDKDTYEALAQTTQIIEQMTQLILKDYQVLVEEDLEDLDLEINIAKNNLNLHNEENRN